MMSLKLANSNPDDLEIKTFDLPGSGLEHQPVLLGHYEISLFDFLCAAYYVLTNTDLHSEDDPRLDFVEAVKKMEVVPGGDYEIEGKPIPTKKLSGGGIYQDWFRGPTLKDILEVHRRLSVRQQFFGFATPEGRQEVIDRCVKIAQDAVMEEQGITDLDAASKLPEDTPLGKKSYAALIGLRRLL